MGMDQNDAVHVCAIGTTGWFFDLQSLGVFSSDLVLVAKLSDTGMD